jgi:hypothetical protein
MKWKVVIMGPTGIAYNTPAFRLLYSFSAREDAEAHADCFRSVMKVALCDERGNLTACGAPFGAGTNHNK